MIDSQLQQKRLIAALIDIAVAGGIMVVFWVIAFVFTLLAGKSSGAAFGYLGRILGFIGGLVSLGYVLGRDVLAGGNSLGKKSQGIRVLTQNGAPIGFMDSAKRNAFFGIGSALGLLSATLGLVPCVGDAVRCLLTPLWLLGILAGLVVAVIELIKITQEPDGIRLGDAFAGTRVVR